MTSDARPFATRFLLVLLVLIVSAAWFSDVQDNGPYVLRNLLPLAIIAVLVLLTLKRGNGSFTRAGWRMPLAILGFSIPALGLSIYLHYAYATNLHGLFDGATQPEELFRFLPVYTLVAGGIGAAIGWIVGRNV